MLKRFSSLFIIGLLCAFPIYGSWTFIDHANESIEMHWITESSLQGEENVFIQACLEAYQPYTPQMLGVQDKFTLLKALFADIKADFLQKNGYFLSAKKEGKVIGFIQFKQTDIEHQIYIGQIAVSPEYWKSGIGKELLMAVFKRWPQTNHILAITRSINVHARKFYEKMGFSTCDYMRAEFDATKYIAYEWKKPLPLGQVSHSTSEPQS